MSAATVTARLNRLPSACHHRCHGQIQRYNCRYFFVFVFVFVFVNCSVNFITHHNFTLILLIIAVHSIFLAFLHCFVVLGSTVAVPTVIVPLMGGGKEEKAQLILNFIFAAGIATLLHSYVGTRLPVVMGSSYAYLIPAISVAMSKSFGKHDHDQFKDSIRAIQGSLMAAGIFQIVFPFTGALRVYWRFLNPVTIVPLVTLTGFGVLAFGFPKLLVCAEVGLLSLAVLVFLSLTLPYMLHSRATLFNNNKWLRWMLRSDGTIFRLYSILLSAGFLWLISAIFSVAHYYEKRSVDAQHYCDARHTWLVGASAGFVFPSPWHWGTPTFNVGDYFAAMSAAFVVIIESSGAWIAASRYGGATPIPPHIFLRGTICQGVSTVVASVFGVTGCTVSVENVGLLGLTGVGSRRVIRISAWVMILISVIGKFGAFLASIPLSVVAAWNLMLHGYVVGAGLSYLQFGNHNRYRSLWIVGFSIAIGVSVPAFFIIRRYLAAHGQSSSTAFNNIILVICSSQATVSVLSGMLLDLMYTGREVLSTKRSSGRHWFKRFRHYNRAARTADYYSAPCNLPGGLPQV